MCGKKRRRICSRRRRPDTRQRFSEGHRSPSGITTLPDCGRRRRSAPTFSRPWNSPGPSAPACAGMWSRCRANRRSMFTVSKSAATAMAMSRFDDCPTGAVALPRSRAGSWVSLDRPSGRGGSNLLLLPFAGEDVVASLSLTVGLPLALVVPAASARLPFLSRPLCPVGRRVHLGGRLENNRQDESQSTYSKKTNAEDPVPRWASSTSRWSPGKQQARRKSIDLFKEDQCRRQDISREHKDIPGPPHTSCREGLPSWLLGGCLCSP